VSFCICVNILSLTLVEEHRLWACNNWVKIGHKRGRATGGWRKMHNEKMNNLYSLLDTNRK